MFWRSFKARRKRFTGLTKTRRKRENNNDELENCATCVFSFCDRHVCGWPERAATGGNTRRGRNGARAGRQVGGHQRSSAADARAVQQSHGGRNDGNLSHPGGGGRESGGRQQLDSLGRVGAIADSGCGGGLGHCRTAGRDSAILSSRAVGRRSRRWTAGANRNCF